MLVKQKYLEKFLHVGEIEIFKKKKICWRKRNIFKKWKWRNRNIKINK